MPLGQEVDLGPGHIVLDGVPLLAKGAHLKVACTVQKAIFRMFSMHFTSMHSVHVVR